MEPPYLRGFKKYVLIDRIKILFDKKSYFGNG